MQNRAVVRVFFPNGLFKTASIDGSVTTAELCRMIAKKLSIELSEPVDPSVYALLECRDESRTPWRKSALGTFSRRLDPSEHPFAVVASWVSRGVVAQSRFVLDTSAAAGAPQPSQQQQQQQSALMQPVALTSVACSAPAQQHSPLAAALARGPSSPPPPSPPIQPIQPQQPQQQQQSAEEAEADVRACLDFVNEQLARRGTTVRDINELRSGVPLIQLLEQLTELKIKPYHERPRNKEEELANWTTALKFLKLQGCTLQNSIPEDFFYGSVTTILSLLAVIAKHFGDTPPIAKAVRKSLLLRRYSRRVHEATSTDPAVSSRQQQQQQQQQQQPESALAKKEKDLADKEAFLTSWERSLQQREEDLARRERLFQQQSALPDKPVSPAPVPSGATLAPGSRLQMPPVVAARAVLGSSPSSSAGGNLFAMLQRRISRCERGLQRPISMAPPATSRSEIMEPPPGLIRVQIIGDASDSLQTQTVSFRYQPEQTVRELLELVCAKKGLKEDEWTCKFMNMDVTCSGDLTIGELGVIALRMCRKRPGDVVASDLGDLCDEFEPVVDIDRASAAAADEDDGLRRSTFNIERLQESEPSLY